MLFEKLSNYFNSIFEINICILKYRKTMLCLIKVTKLSTLISNLVTIPMLKLDVLPYSKAKWCILVVLTMKDKWVYWNVYFTVTEDFIKVSQIENCQMTRIGELPFKYSWGSCNTFLEPNPRVLLCFNRDDPKVCHTLVF